MTNTNDVPASQGTEEHGTWRPDVENGNGSALKWADLTWTGISKVLVGQACKYGFNALLLILVIGAVLWGTFQLGKIWLDQDHQKIVAVENASKQQEESNKQSREMTAAFVSSQEASKKADAKMVENVVLLTENLALVSQAITGNGQRLADIEENGTVKAREILVALQEASKKMAVVPGLREQQLEEAKRNNESLERLNKAIEVLNGTQDKILAAINGSKLIPAGTLAIP